MLLALALAALAAPTDVKTGPWHAWLDSPGGELPFELVIDSKDGKLTSTVINGSERIAVPDTRVEGDELVFDFPYYDATLRAKIGSQGKQLDGEWKKRKGRDAWAHLAFHAMAGEKDRFSSFDFGPTDPEGKPVIQSRRWSVRFEKSDRPAVLVWTGELGSAVEATFLTSTGDYRFLAGRWIPRTIHLSCFDGTHAFLFFAVLQPDDTLVGDFWSGDSWHETWTAKRDDNAKLDDELSLTHWNPEYSLALLQYPDLEGKLVSLADPRFDGKVRVLQITGSWCPNCHDETELLAELDKKYRDKGLAIVALNFETTGEFEHDATQAKRMLARHHATYPALLAGRSDKALAEQAFPAFDKFLAFPTTVFFHKDGRVRAVHTGFSGPATGAAYDHTREQFESLVTELLAEREASGVEVANALTGELWRDERDRVLVECASAKDGRVSFKTWEMLRFDRPTKHDPLAQGNVEIRGSTARFSGTIWSYDAHAGVLLDASDVAHRLTPSIRLLYPLVDEEGAQDPLPMAAWLSRPEPLRRREAAYYLPLAILHSQQMPRDEGGGRFETDLAQHLLPLLTDADPLTRATACWAAGKMKLAAAEKALVANLEHGFAPVRREAARALLEIGADPKLDGLVKLAHDIDPLVRAAVPR
jgi:thiol-disulfide isomerase/thioredoxin